MILVLDANLQVRIFAFVLSEGDGHAVTLNARQK